MKIIIDLTSKQLLRVYLEYQTQPSILIKIHFDCNLFTPPRKLSLSINLQNQIHSEHSPNKYLYNRLCGSIYQSVCPIHKTIIYPRLRSADINRPNLSMTANANRQIHKAPLRLDWGCNPPWRR